MPSHGSLAMVPGIVEFRGKALPDGCHKREDKMTSLSAEWKCPANYSPFQLELGRY